MPSLMEEYMITSVEQYLVELRAQLSGSDRATIQDAVSDAEEYLRTALSNVASGESATPAESLQTVIIKYGTPAEIAAAYRQLESSTAPALGLARTIEPQEPPMPQERRGVRNRPLYLRFFGVFAEARAWGSLFYLVFALATGIIYFTWAVTGLSVSLSLLILIIGLPVAWLFLLSIRGIALVEGRMVEALLGVRMPRRARFTEKKTGVWQHFKGLISDEHTWFSLVYMVLQMPLGIIYFTLFITLAAVSLALVVWPIVSVILREPLFVVFPHEYFATGWLIPFSAVAGLLLLTSTMHLAKAIGRIHGALAKALLVRP